MIAPMPFTATGSRYAAGYIRESSEESDRDPELQKAGQREDIATAAKRDGTDPATLREYDDWGRSGSEHARRPAQEQLLKDARAGQVAVIYTRSLDRLMRSTQRLRDLWVVCAATGTRIVTLREGDVSADKIESNPSAWMFVQSIMTAAEYESRVGRVRARASVATKRREGRPMGQLPYGAAPGEDVARVRAAFHDAGSFLGAASRLNIADVPTRHGGKWDTRTVSRILRKIGAAPPAVPSGRGVRATAPHLFSGLLLCDCGATLTSMVRGTSPSRRQAKPTTCYYCRNAHRDASHPRPYVIAEARVLTWAKEVLADYTTLNATRLGKLQRAAEGSTAKRAELLAKRDRWIEQYGEGLIGKAERDRKLADVAAELVRVEPPKPFVIIGTGAVPGAFRQVSWVDWEGSPADVNAELRRIWSAIHLDHVPAKNGKPATWAPTRPDWLPGAREWVEGRDGEAEHRADRDAEREAASARREADIERAHAAPEAPDADLPF